MVLTSGYLVDERFEIVRPIGVGSYGVVYEARQSQLERRVALKILNEAVDSESALRLMREGQILSSIRHRNIISFYGYGLWEEKPYLAVEFVEGRSLQLELCERGALTVRRSMEICLQIAEGLACAHAAGVVHRDLKPANVILTEGPDGHDLIKIIDFGLSKLLARMGTTVQQLTSVGMTVGTVQYMSPEQCLGKEACPQSDIYALGCILYECLAGQPLFDSDTSVGLMMQHVKADVLPLPASSAVSDQLIRELQTILDKCLEKEPAHRYAVMEELACELDRLLQVCKRDRLSNTVLDDSKRVSSTKVAVLDDSDSFPKRSVSFEDAQPLSSQRHRFGQNKRAVVRTFRIVAIASIVLLGIGGLISWICKSQGSSSVLGQTDQVEKYFDLARACQSDGNLKDAEKDYLTAISAAEKQHALLRKYAVHDDPGSSTALAFASPVVRRSFTQLLEMYRTQQRYKEMVALTKRKIDLCDGGLSVPGTVAAALDASDLACYQVLAGDCEDANRTVEQNLRRCAALRQSKLCDPETIVLIETGAVQNKLELAQTYLNNFCWKQSEAFADQSCVLVDPLIRARPWTFAACYMLKARLLDLTGRTTEADKLRLQCFRRIISAGVDRDNRLMAESAVALLQHGPLPETVPSSVHAEEWYQPIYEIAVVFAHRSDDEQGLLVRAYCYKIFGNRKGVLDWEKTLLPVLNRYDEGMNPKLLQATDKAALESVTCDTDRTNADALIVAGFERAASLASAGRINESDDLFQAALAACQRVHRGLLLGPAAHNAEVIAQKAQSSAVADRLIEQLAAIAETLPGKDFPVFVRTKVYSVVADRFLYRAQQQHLKNESEASRLLNAAERYYLKDVSAAAMLSKAARANAAFRLARLYAYENKIEKFGRCWNDALAFYRAESTPQVVSGRFEQLVAAFAGGGNAQEAQILRDDQILGTTDFFRPPSLSVFQAKLGDKSLRVDAAKAMLALAERLALSGDAAHAREAFFAGIECCERYKLWQPFETCNYVPLSMAGLGTLRNSQEDVREAIEMSEAQVAVVSKYAPPPPADNDLRSISISCEADCKTALLHMAYSDELAKELETRWKASLDALSKSAHLGNIADAQFRLCRHYVFTRDKDRCLRWWRAALANYGKDDAGLEPRREKELIQICTSSGSEDWIPAIEQAMSK